MPSVASRSSRRVFVYDAHTGKRFLIDSGAEISVLPPTPGAQPASDIVLTAANGTRIRTYGPKTLQLDFGFNRTFPWTFEMADVSRPIIGADFLHYFGLLIDIKRSRLIDPRDRRSIEIAAVNEHVAPIFTATRAAKWTELLRAYPDVTRESPVPIKFKHDVVHELHTTGPPLFARPRRLPPERYRVARREFDYMLNKGICRPSSSPWASPLLLVAKKDGTCRPCGDYRRLNSVTRADRYPLPHLHDFTTYLSTKTVFTKLDLVKAYHQVPIAKADIPKTAVTTPFGLFEFPVMCFGLRNAAQTFQRVVNEMLRGLDFAFAYIDDVLIASCDEREHEQHVRMVLDRLKSFGMSVNPAKCVFAAASLPFLGHVIDKDGCRPSPERVSAIREWPLPVSKKELQRFLGTMNFYHRFISNAATIQATLYDLVAQVKKKDGPIRWTTDARNSFELCRKALATTATLAHPIADAQLRLSTDASSVAVGAVIEQKNGELWQPLGFFSKKLLPAETRYSTYDRELLAAYLGTKHFIHFIEGRVTTLCTDHKPLTFMFTQKSEKYVDRQVRQISFLSQYIHTVEHVNGTDNVVSDALSRLEVANIQKGLPDQKQWSEAQAADEQLQNILLGKIKCSLRLQPRETPHGPVFTDNTAGTARTYVPAMYRRGVFDALHGLAHGGRKATFRLVKERYCWPDMSRDIGQWSRCCVQCQRAKVSRHISAPVIPFAPTERRFGHIHVDLVGPLPSSNGNKYLLTCVDRFTRWPEAWPLDNMSTHAVAVTLVSQWFARFGVPDIITTDQGRQFESELFRHLSSSCGIQHIRTSPYHPQANGMVERFHRTLKDALTAHESPNWTTRLPLVLLALRSTIKPDMDASPAELVYGTTLRLPGELFHAAPPTTPSPDFIVALRESMAQLRPTPGTNHHTRRSIFVPKNLSDVSHVFLRVDAVKPPLQPRFEGPYAVLERREKTLRLQCNNRQVWVSIDRLKPAFVLREDPLADHTYAAHAFQAKVKKRVRFRLP